MNEKLIQLQLRFIHPILKKLPLTYAHLVQMHLISHFFLSYISLFKAFASIQCK